MEREAFRQRMQQYKQARENNPQLKYWDWKKYADGGEVRDNTYVAPVYKEQVFIPATGAQKIKNDSTNINMVVNRRIKVENQKQLVQSLTYLLEQKLHMTQLSD